MSSTLLTKMYEGVIDNLPPELGPKGVKRGLGSITNLVKRIEAESGAEFLGMENYMGGPRTAGIGRSCHFYNNEVGNFIVHIKYDEIDTVKTYATDLFLRVRTAKPARGGGTKYKFNWKWKDYPSRDDNVKKMYQYIKSIYDSLPEGTEKVSREQADAAGKTR